MIDVLARGLQATGHEVLLFTTGDSTCEVPREFVVPVAPGIDIGGSALEVQHVEQAYLALREMDIIHDHTALGPLLFGRDSVQPTVTTNHNPFAEPFASLYRLLGGKVAIVAISEHHARSAPPIPIAAVIHHGVFPEDFPVGDGSGDYALFLGRITPDKGAHRAVHLARAAGLRLVLAGKKHTEREERYFEEEVRPLLDDGSEFLGEVDVPTKLALLGGARCLLNPIAWPEPFGMVMIEALACGTPVVALPHGAASEIVTDGVTGFLREQPEELVAALGRLDEIDRGACRAVVEGHFSAQRMVAEHLALYDSLLNSRGGRP